MIWEKTVQGIGPVHFRKSKRARRISVRIKPFQPVEVVLPFYASVRSGEKFLHRKSSWIRKTVDKVHHRKKGQMLLEHHPGYGQIIARWKKEAQDYLPAALHALAQRHGFQIGKLSLRNNRARWGSCSHKNNISLNIRLMRLPRHLIDYVILHELVHTLHKNHGREFWDLLDKITGDARGLDRELSRYHPELIEEKR